MAKKLYVGNLPHSTTENELQGLFASYGNVMSAQVIVDRDTGRSKGFGFVEMPNDEEANKAIAALNETELDGRTIVVKPANPKTDSGNRQS